MAIRNAIQRVPIFPLLIAASLIVGWFIPAFYDWTGSDQSRPSPLIGPFAIGMLVSVTLFCLALPWLPAPPPAHPNGGTVRTRFTIRTALIVTAIVAALIATAMKFPLVTSGGVYAIVWCWVVWTLLRFRHYRLPTAALLACLYCPFAWIASWNGLSGILEALFGMAVGLPAFFITLFAGRWMGQHFDALTWLSMLLTALELAAGLWVIRQGPKLTIAYCLWVLLISVAGSFVLNALVRM
ncbi:hypothetical protein Enr13x_45690 [Stieleria neptunia]|uniref:Uncharacterized protein n=1 Tax=Stieleria neptunia TaxID=2527979 RepID=A0A518HV05_9BACT|nr:hypothetical protein [Stieleria neptunia]QDV44701.1 hypothetical protein Enr13x_45690 [Stieleria neptunia]